MADSDSDPLALVHPLFHDVFPRLTVPYLDHLRARSVRCRHYILLDLEQVARETTPSSTWPEAVTDCRQHIRCSKGRGASGQILGKA